MAELSTTQRANLLASSRFLKRMKVAASKTAKYWNDYTIDAYNKYTVANQKRKTFARVVLNGQLPDPGYAATFLSSYNTDVSLAGKLEDDQQAFDAETNQLSDAELTESPSAPYTFDHHAQVKPGDEATQIQL